MKIEVLDQGFIQFVDKMGTDSDIAQAARVSFNNHNAAVDEESDRKLIRYLMRHRHTTPFEMCEMKFLVRVPMDCWRQWIRHRTANVNEYSTRYKEAIDAMAKTPPDKWRLQSTNNKQGSSGYLEEAKFLSEREEAFHNIASEVYKERLYHGVAREQARKDLPLSTYTEAYWKCDLHNIFNFLSLRMDSHAQYEIRMYANAMAQMVSEHFPIAYEAFKDYKLNAITFSRLELDALHSMVYCKEDEELACKSAGLVGREKDEFFQKLKQLR